MSLGESKVPHGAGGLGLKWIGDGAWCAVDASFPEGDARRLIAYVECRRAEVEVVWVHCARRPGRFVTLRDAWRAIEDELALRDAAAVPELTSADIPQAEPAVA